MDSFSQVSITVDLEIEVSTVEKKQTYIQYFSYVTSVFPHISKGSSYLGNIQTHPHQYLRSLAKIFVCCSALIITHNNA
jgi:hypothetical protein